MFRTREDNERIRTELTAAVERSANGVGTVMYAGRLVHQIGAGRGDPVYRVGTRDLPTLDAALDRIDVERPDDEVIGLFVNAGRGGYRPDEVAEIARQCITFGRVSALQSGVDRLTSALPRG